MSRSRVGWVASFGLLLCASARAQTVFAYSATDYRSMTITGPGTTTISVGTVVIVQGTPGLAPVGPTDGYSIRYRPPEVVGAHLVMAVAGGRSIPLTVLRSDIDGGVEARVEIPRTAQDVGDVKLDWATKDGQLIEMTVTPALMPAAIDPPTPLPTPKPVARTMGRRVARLH